MAEDTEKLIDVEGATAMLAGSMSAARELLNCCKESAREYGRTSRNDLAVSAFLTSLRSAVGDRTKQVKDAYLRANYGMSFDDFLTKARDQLPESIYLQMWTELEKVGLGAALILSSFTDDEALLVSVSQSGHVSWDEHYSAIGSGDVLANAIIRQRDYSDSMPLARCVYCVLEAKIAAERDPHVGEAYSLMVKTEAGELEIDDRYLNRLVETIDRRRVTIPRVRRPKNWVKRVTASDAGNDTEDAQE